MNAEFGAKKPKWFPDTSKHLHLREDSNKDLQRVYKLVHFSVSELGDTTKLTQLFYTMASTFPS